MKTPKLRKPPTFPSEDAERSFWATHDSTEYVEWPAGRARSLRNLKPTLRTISIRLPESMIGYLKVLANKRDMPYQSLLKQLLAEQLKLELTRPNYKPEPRKRSGSTGMVHESAAKYAVRTPKPPRRR